MRIQHNIDTTFHSKEPSRETATALFVHCGQTNAAHNLHDDDDDDAAHIGAHKPSMPSQLEAVYAQNVCTLNVVTHTHTHSL